MTVGDDTTGPGAGDCGDAIVDSLFLPIGRVAPGGRCVRANRAFRDQLGGRDRDSVFALLGIDEEADLSTRIRDALEHDLAWSDLELSVVRAVGARTTMCSMCARDVADSSACAQSCVI